MNDRDALLSAIHNAPDDDAPRLVFADWLDENGEPERAEFIRVQVEMRRERERHDRITPRLDELFLRQKEIFARPWGDVARRCGADAISQYSRGFPNYLQTTATQFVELGPNIGIWIGPQTRIGLYECAGMTKRLASQRSLRLVRRLVIGRGHEESPHRDEDLEAFFASPHLASLRELEVLPPTRSFRAPPPQPLSARTAFAIASATSLTALEKLDVSGIPIRGDGVAALARSSHLATLRTLILGSAGISRRAVESLRRSPYLTQLKSLEIVGGEIPPATMTLLTEQFGPEVVKNRVINRVARR